MTDRLKGLVVVFSEDIREDDAEALLGLLRLSSWVSRVKPLVSHPGDHATEWRVKRSLEVKLLKLIEELNS